MNGDRVSQNLTLESIPVRGNHVHITFNNLNVDCMIGAMLVNHLMYADDLVLFAPLSRGLSDLLSACSDYGREHDIKYNSAKSNVMIFLL